MLALTSERERRTPTPHSAHLEAVTGAVWRRLADEVFQEFGLVILGGSGKSGSGVIRDSVGFVSHVLLLQPSLLPQVFGLPTRRPASIGADACIAEKTHRRAELHRYGSSSRQKKSLSFCPHWNSTRQAAPLQLLFWKCLFPFIWGFPFVCFLSH